MNKFISCVLGVVAVFCSVVSLSGYTSSKITLKMSDGTELVTRIMMPADTTKLPLPVILSRTPYGSSNVFEGLESTLTDLAGFVLVSQDVRGRYGSQDTFRLFMDDGWNEKRDGYETIEWIAVQPWCNGRIGMFGASALGITQYVASVSNPPHLTCGIPLVAALDLYRYAAYPGGIYREFDIDKWIGGVSPTMVEIAHENYVCSSYWDRVNCRKHLDSMNTPFLHVGGWFDIFSPAQLDAYYDLQYNGGEGARGKQKVIIGPWTHTLLFTNKIGDITFPSNASLDVTMTALGWLSHWLTQGNNAAYAGIPNIQIYQMGPVDTTGYWNSWKSYEDWPFTDTDTLTMFPGVDGSISNTLPFEDKKKYKTDPKDPIPTIGGNNMSFQGGPCDQSPNWERADLLVFESPAYSEPYDIFGKPLIDLRFSVKNKDIDLFARLVDIYPDGRKIYITEGFIRGRFLQGFEKEVFLNQGYILSAKFDLGCTSYTIAPGHKLGLMISSSNYPKHSVNPNNGKSFLEGDDYLVADNTVYFGGANPTVLRIPILKTGFKMDVQDGAGHDETAAFVVSDGILDLSGLTVNCEGSYSVLSLEGRTVLSCSIANTGSRISFNYPRGIYFLVMDGARAYRVLNY